MIPQIFSNEMQMQLGHELHELHELNAKYIFEITRITRGGGSSAAAELSGEHQSFLG
jgi:hypothetical protein